jgi:hypothetical protein
MKRTKDNTQWIAAMVVGLVTTLTPAIGFASGSPQVTLDASKTAPRAVEPLTERSILRDYKFAWTNLAEALESNSISPLNGLFVGDASALLNEKVASQQRSGLSSRFRNQSQNSTRFSTLQKVT